MKRRELCSQIQRNVNWTQQKNQQKKCSNRYENNCCFYGWFVSSSVPIKTQFSSLQINLKKFRIVKSNMNTNGTIFIKCNLLICTNITYFLAALYMSRVQRKNCVKFVRRNRNYLFLAKSAISVKRSTIFLWIFRDAKTLKIFRNRFKHWHPTVSIISCMRKCRA